MGTLRLLLGHFNGIKEPLLWEQLNPLERDFTNQKARRELRQRELEGFGAKVRKTGEMGEKDKKRRKMSVFIWNGFK